MVTHSTMNFTRDNLLEDDWSRKYTDVTGSNTLDHSLASLYAYSEFSIPNLFFNTTHVESGSKAIVSNLRLDTFFKDDLDLLADAEQSIPLKTAALLSARFPIISPPGLVKTPDKRDVGQFVDGQLVDTC